MQYQNNFVFGMFNTRDETAQAIKHLKTLEIKCSDISVVSLSQRQRLLNLKFLNSKINQDARGQYAFLKSLNLLSETKSIKLRQWGPILAAGPIVNALAEINRGKLTAAFLFLGVPDDEASQYERHILNGGVLLCVQTVNGEWSEKVRQVINENNGKLITTIDGCGLDWRTGPFLYKHYNKDLVDRHY